MEQIIKNILNKEGIKYSQLTKATSGFTNIVYFIDNQFVIKMSKEETVKKKLYKEISIYKKINITCVPKLISSGEFDEYTYLIISKVQGHSLYSIWHTLTPQERENAVKQIAEILKDFNEQDYKFLDGEYKDLNWVEYISQQLKVISKNLKDMGVDSENIDYFIENNLSELFSENIYGLVYNDAHFDNFIYDKGNLSLIDFDRVRVCPIDYEMLIFKTMCDNPLKFASEEDEDKIKEEDYTEIYNQFKTEYPQLFEIRNIDKRVKVYQFIYLMGQAIKCKDQEWIKELLLNYKF